MDEYEVTIQADVPWYKLNLRELFRYKDLVILFVKRNFSLVYKQTVLGPLWLVLSPLFTSIVYTFVFGQFAGLSTEGIPQLLFYMSGTTIWGLFNSGVQGISNTFLNNAHIFGKVYFPRLTVPISQAITSIINFGIQFAMLMLFYLYYIIMGTAVPMGASMLILPILVLQTAALAMAIGIIIASVTVKYRDLAIAATFGLQLWMYLTPVVYPLSSTEGIMRSILLVNPMTAIVNNFRYALFGEGELLTWAWLCSTVVTLVLLVLGAIMYSRTERTFVDKV